MFILYAYALPDPTNGIIFTIEFVPSGAIQALSVLVQPMRHQPETAKSL